MKTQIILIVLLFSSFYMIGKTSIEGCWISVGSENKIFCFEDNNLLRISSRDISDTIEFSIEILNDKITVYREEKSDLTYLVNKIDANKIALYNTVSKVVEFTLLKGRSNIDSNNLSSFFANISFRCSVYNSQTDKYKIYERSEFLSNFFKLKRDCYLEYSTTHRLEQYGIELKLKEHGVWSSDRRNYFVSVIVTELNDDSVVGYNIEDGYKVIFNQISEPEFFSIVDKEKMVGSYGVHNIKDGILTRIQENISTIHIGHSSYTLNDDNTCQFDDKSHNQVLTGRWQAIEYRNKRYLEFVWINQRNMTIIYSDYFELIEINDRYLIIENPSCEAEKDTNNKFTWVLIRLN